MTAVATAAITATAATPIFVPLIKTAAPAAVPPTPVAAVPASAAAVALPMTSTGVVAMAFAATMDGEISDFGSAR